MSKKNTSMDHTITVLADHSTELQHRLKRLSISFETELSHPFNTRSDEKTLLASYQLFPDKQERISITNLLNDLRSQQISFGYQWAFDSVTDRQSGECHYRHSDTVDQLLEWDDRDKNRVLLEDLIDAHHNGDISVADLITVEQSKYLPEDWSAVSSPCSPATA